MKKIKPYLRRRIGAHTAGTSISYTPDQIAALYQFPKVTTGTEQTIAIVELGGGFLATDIASYFAKLGLPAPKVEAVSVGGGTNSPGVDENADGEVTLDVLVAAAAYSYCTGTPANIKVFFAPDASFAAAIAQAAADPSKPVACSISWGAPETSWSAPDISAMEDALKAAASAGMTVLVAAGDNGSSDGGSGHHVDYPASSPQVLGCGGTSLRASNGAITSESVWNDGSRGGATGGGYSAIFHRPPFQNALVKHLTRGVPDIAGDADPDTGYVVTVDGIPHVFGGTSAVAPLMAALVAIVCKRDGRRLGFVNNAWYEQPGSFRDVLIGNNGAFRAGSGWDPTTGLGVPIGAKL